METGSGAGDERHASEVRECQRERTDALALTRPDGIS